MTRRQRKRLADAIASRVADGVEARIDVARRASPVPPPPAPPPPAAAPPGGQLIVLDYPTSARNRPRWGDGRPAHAGLERLLERWSAEPDVLLERMAAALGKACSGIAEALPESDPRPRWKNPMMAGFDACAIGAVLAGRPRQYLEVGSGNSTKFARHFIDALGLATRLTSIDPTPRAECDALCDEALRVPVEDVPLDVFSRLAPGDVLFFDGSHRCFMNSDVTTLFLDVIPSLEPGVIVGIHDTFLPYDYPPEWAERYYSEEYVLAAYLLGAGERIRVLLPAHRVCLRDAASPRFAAARAASGCPADVFHGCSFWFTHERRA